MAASSSGTRPRSTARSPAAATSASSIGRFESRIWPGASGPARRHELVAGGQHARPGAGARRDLGAADAGQHPEVGRAEHRAGGEDRVAGAHVVAAPRTAVPAATSSVSSTRVRAGRAAPLDHDHGVGTGGHRRAGHDPDRLARADRPVGGRPAITWPRPGAGPAGRAGAGGVGGPHGEAVHGRVGEGRHRLGRRRPRRSRRPRASASGTGRAGSGAHAVEHARPRLLERDHARHRTARPAYRRQGGEEVLRKARSRGRGRTAPAPARRSP